MDARFISNASKITAKPDNYLKKHVFLFSDQERNLCKHGVCARMNRKKNPIFEWYTQVFHTVKIFPNSNVKEKKNTITSV